MSFVIKKSELKIPEKQELLPDDVMRAYVKEHPIRVVAATVGEDEHSVGLREIIDIKHGGIEKYGVDVVYLGTSCPVEKLIDAAIETKAQAIVMSTIITHNDVHTKNMQKIHDLCIEKGVRDRFIIACGGTQVTNEIAVAHGMDAGFGRGTHGNNVASFIIETLMKKDQE